MSRALAHIEIVDQIDELPGYDRVASAHILGWRVIISKEEIHVGDKVVYFEIDSLVPSNDERFSFMEKKHYKVKTQKMCKSISQGLAMPISLFPEIEDLEVGTDVTEKLKVTYYSIDDRQRKSNKVTKEMKYKRMMAKHPKLAKTRLCRWLMKRKWGQELLFIFLGQVKDREMRFPHKFEFIHKTDETRCESLPQNFLEDKTTWIQTTKLDGTSSTYILERKPFGWTEYYVCSRNVRQMNENQKTYHDNNVYWDMEFKYHIKDFLMDMLKMNPKWEYVCLQGETVGVGVQGNPHKLSDTQFFGFNLIDSENGRWNTVDAAELCKAYGIQWVPIVNTEYVLPDTMEELKLQADGDLSDNLSGASGLREGFVYRNTKNHNISFKNVSRKYLLEHS